MFAIAHDYRLQRQERGYQCAIEIAIGIRTPAPELTLFRHWYLRISSIESCFIAHEMTGADVYLCVKLCGFFLCFPLPCSFFLVLATSRELGDAADSKHK